ncbi:MAG: DDE-type integrase/transposase/recombinase [Thermoplasmata archaeon]
MSREKGWERAICRYCGSDEWIRWGWRYSLSRPKQRYRCKDCSRTFVVDDGFLGKRLPPEAVCAAWDLFFRGTSLEDIFRHLEVCWSLQVTARAILEWVRGYSRLLADWAESLMATRKVDGGQRWHQDIAVLKRGREKRYVWLLRGRGHGGKPILLAARYSADRKEEHAVALLREAVRRTESLPQAVVSDGEWAFEGAYHKVLYHKHRKEVRLVHGVPIAYRKHGRKHNNNPAEQMVDELKDWYRHMNGFSSDRSAADLVRGWFVHENLVDAHSRKSTWAERAGLDLGLPMEDRVHEIISRAARWRVENRRSSTNR